MQDLVGSQEMLRNHSKWNHEVVEKNCIWWKCCLLQYNSSTWMAHIFAKNCTKHFEKCVLTV